MAFLTFLINFKFPTIIMPKLSKFKVVLVGDQNVGKTSIISRFIHDSFQFTPNPTVGIDFVTKTMQVQGETLRLQLWDTAGQQRFRALIPSYVRDADACLIVLDVSVRSSIDGIDKWLDFVRESRGHDALVILIGNKSDLSDRQVSTKQLQDYAEKNRYVYIQVSAKNGTNIHNLFRKLSERLIDSKNGVADRSLNQSVSDNKSKNVKTSNTQKIALTNKDAKMAGKLKSQCKC